MRLLALVCFVACNHPGGFGKTGEPFGLFANLRMGMTVDEVTKIAPGLKPDPEDHDHWTVKTTDGSLYAAYFVDGHVAKFEIELPSKVLRADLEYAWGSPRREDAAYSIVYTNAAKTIRVEAPSGDSVDLTYSPMVPAEKLLGKDTFDGVKLLGRRVTDVKHDFSNRPRLQNEKWLANDYGASMNNVFPATELWWNTVLVVDSGDDAIVRHWHLSAVFDSDPEAIAALNAMFEKLWGKPRKDGDSIVYGIDPVITVDKTGEVIEAIRVDTKKWHDSK